MCHGADFRRKSSVAKPNLDALIFDVVNFYDFSYELLILRSLRATTWVGRTTENNKETWDDIYQIIIALGDLRMGSLRAGFFRSRIHRLRLPSVASILNIKLIPKSVSFIICEHLISFYFIWIYRSTGEHHKTISTVGWAAAGWVVSSRLMVLASDSGMKFLFTRLLFNPKCLFSWVGKIN